MKNNQLTRELLNKAFDEAKKKSLTEAASQPSDQTESQTEDSSEQVRLISQEYADRLDELPADWRQYLIKLDAEYTQNKKRQSRQLDHWLEHLFGLRDQQVCCHTDETPREWVEKMAYIEHMLCAQPKRTLSILSQIYLSPTLSYCSEYAPITNYYKKRCEENAKNWLCKCLSEKDQKGNACFPYKEAVIELILTLLSNRLAPDIQKAYDMAVWMNEKTRAQMIDSVLNDRIRQKVDEARIAREKSFLTEGAFDISSQNKTEKSTRELLEEAFRKYRTK